MKVRELKRQLAQGRTTKGYPADLRAEAVRYAEERQATGVMQGRIAHDLGVLDQTLRYWRKLARRRSKPALTAELAPAPASPTRLARASKLVPVTVADQPTRLDGLVVECGPLRIRGLDLAGVVSLLRSLG